MKKRPFYHFCALLFSILLLCPEVCLPHGFEKQVQELNDSEPAAIVEGTTFSVGDLKNLVAMRSNPAGNEFILFNINDLLDAARLSPGYKKLADEAKANGVSLSEDDERWVGGFLRDYVERKLFSEYIVANRETPTTDSIVESYEQQKDARFYMPERMVVRQMYFSPTEDASAEENALAVWNRLESGEDFKDIQRELTRKGNGAPPTQVVILEELQETKPELHGVLQSLGDGEYSRPLSVPEGWAILKRQLLIPRSYMPLDSVYQILHDEWIIENDMKHISRFFIDVATDAGIISIHPQNLLNTGALAFDSDVMLTIGERSFTRGELRNLLGWRFAQDVPHNERTFAELVLSAGPVQHELIDYLVERKDLMKAEDIVRLRNKAEETALVRHLLSSRFPEEQTHVDDDTIAGIAESQRIDLTIETREKIRKQLIARRRAEFEFSELNKAAADVEYEPLIGSNARPK